MAANYANIQALLFRAFESRVSGKKIAWAGSAMRLGFLSSLLFWNRANAPRLSAGLSSACFFNLGLLGVEHFAAEVGSRSPCPPEHDGCCDEN